jgi:hypothetical protein
MLMMESLEYQDQRQAAVEAELKDLREAVVAFQPQITKQVLPQKGKKEKMPCLSQGSKGTALLEDISWEDPPLR